MIQKKIRLTSIANLEADQAGKPADQIDLSFQDLYIRKIQNHCYMLPLIAEKIKDKKIAGYFKEWLGGLHSCDTLFIVTSNMKPITRIRKGGIPTLQNLVRIV